MIFRLGELFSGPGGFTCGALDARVKKDKEIYSVTHAWANDIDIDSCETYRNNICPEDKSSVIAGPVEELDIEKLGPIDAFAYGFPCNDFSLVGEHNGLDGSYGGLYSYGVQVLDYHKPLWFFAENVGGILSANNGKAFRVILKALANAGPGYVLTPHLYKFEEYRIPQTRHRIIIIGIRRDESTEKRVDTPSSKRTELGKIGLHQSK